MDIQELAGRIGIATKGGLGDIARGAINAKTKNIRRYRTIAIILDGLISIIATTAGRLSSI